MTIKQGSIVKITGQPGSADKWPFFFTSFLGKTGKVVGPAVRGVWDDKRVMMTVALDNIGQINVDREWLTQLNP